jgi:hypothetical protein
MHTKHHAAIRVQYEMESCDLDIPVGAQALLGTKVKCA